MAVLICKGREMFFERMSITVDQAENVSLECRILYLRFVLVFHLNTGTLPTSTMQPN